MFFREEKRMKQEAILLLKESKQALINRDAVACYNSGTFPCVCTLCKIERFLNKYENENTVENLD